MKKRLISMLLIVVMTIAVLSINAFAVCTEYSVGMHGTRGKPAGASDSTENWYYSYYSNQSYWVGANYKSTGKQVYMVQAYLFADGEFTDISSVDGVWGQNTDTQIRAYQFKYSGDGLTSDGVVGTNTWKHMAYIKYQTTISYLLPFVPNYI